MWDMWRCSIRCKRGQKLPAFEVVAWRKPNKKSWSIRQVFICVGVTSVIAKLFEFCTQKDSWRQPDTLSNQGTSKCQAELETVGEMVGGPWNDDWIQGGEVSQSKDFGKVQHAQLHHFSDASKGGYGIAPYVWMTNHRKCCPCVPSSWKSQSYNPEAVTIPNPLLDQTNYSKYSLR